MLVLNSSLFAQIDCSKALIQDLTAQSVDESSVLHYLNIIDEEIYKKAQSEGGFGFELPIDGVPFGADADYNDFSEWRKKKFQQNEFTHSSNFSSNYLSKKVSADGYKSYDNCINQTSKAAGLFIKVVDSDKKFVTIEIYYKITTGSQLNDIIVQYSDLKNGKISGVADGKLFNKDETIRPMQTIRKIITRGNPSESVLGVVNAGDFSQSFKVNGYTPPIPPPTCKPKTIQIDAASYDQLESKNICNNCLGYGVGIITNANASNRENKAVYKFNVSCSGEYVVEIQYTAMQSRPVSISMNNQTFNDSGCDGTTGGWASPTLKWESQGTVLLEKGENKLELYRTTPFPHIRQIKIRPLK